MSITQQLGDDNSVAVTKTPSPFSPNIRSEPIELLGKGAVTFFLEGEGGRRGIKNPHILKVRLNGDKI